MAADRLAAVVCGGGGRCGGENDSQLQRAQRKLDRMMKEQVDWLQAIHAREAIGCS